MPSSRKHGPLTPELRAFLDKIPVAPAPEWMRGAKEYQPGEPWESQPTGAPEADPYEQAGYEDHREVIAPPAAEPDQSEPPPGYSLDLWDCAECDGSGVRPSRYAPPEEQDACPSCPDPDGAHWESWAINADGTPMGQGGMTRDVALAEAWRHYDSHPAVTEVARLREELAFAEQNFADAKRIRARIERERDEARRQLAAVTEQACGESCASEITRLTQERDTLAHRLRLTEQERDKYQRLWQEALSDLEDAREGRG